MKIKKISIDEFNRLASERQTLNLILKENNFTRFYKGHGLPQKANCNVVAVFNLIDARNIQLTINAEGSLMLNCTRCGELMEYKIKEEAVEIVSLGRNQGAFSSLCVQDLTADDGKIELLNLIEDSIYLSIPMYPTHDNC
jgi:uncharacterized metal-binding protein YceD (DUF177 family)